MRKQPALEQPPGEETGCDFLSFSEEGSVLRATKTFRKQAGWFSLEKPAAYQIPQEQIGHRILTVAFNLCPGRHLTYISKQPY